MLLPLRQTARLASGQQAALRAASKAVTRTRGQLRAGSTTTQPSLVRDPIVESVSSPPAPPVIQPSPAQAAGSTASQSPLRSSLPPLGGLSSPQAEPPLSPPPSQPLPLSSRAASQKKKRRPLTTEERDFLSAALRVNQAGELAATLIYTAQTPLITRSHPHLRGLMRHMYEQEAGHLRTFNDLVYQHRVRPTAMYPMWWAASSVLGWATAMMGREAAMACTEAVETEIGDHYNSQIRRLLEIAETMQEEEREAAAAAGELLDQQSSSKVDALGPELKELVGTLRRIRDEELEHLDHAVDNDAQKAQPHWLLTGVIRMGCRGAIWVSERV